MTIEKTALAALPLLALAACAPVDHSFGEATAWNRTVQTINPDGVVTSADAAQPGDNADVAVNSAEAYREGSIERASASSRGGNANGSVGSGQGNPPR
ncbi:hypothetical protein WJT74_03150 [Sphingomicrobium sp. XHP0239]|uniref:hypothetical protein n=1 Tax=Sphingomicrobium maritimum TaxID=3133972 RepID=UPI0031CC7F55